MWPNPHIWSHLLKKFLMKNFIFCSMLFVDLEEELVYLVDKSYRLLTVTSVSIIEVFISEAVFHVRNKYLDILINVLEAGILDSVACLNSFNESPQFSRREHQRSSTVILLSTRGSRICKTPTTYRAAPREW